MAPAGNRHAAIAAVALNLVPVAGVVLWGWSAFARILPYWLENVAIGVRTAVGTVVSGGVRHGPLAGLVLLALLKMGFEALAWVRSGSNAMLSISAEPGRARPR